MKDRKESKIRIKKVTKRPHAKIEKGRDGKFSVYFDFMKVPIKMEFSYLSRLLEKNQIVIKSIIKNQNHGEIRASLPTRA